MISQCGDNRTVNRATDAEKILGYISAHPGTTQVGIAIALKVSLADVHLLVRKLVASGKLERVKP